MNFYIMQRDMHYDDEWNELLVYLEKLNCSTMINYWIIIGYSNRYMGEREIIWNIQLHSTLVIKYKVMYQKLFVIKRNKYNNTGDLFSMFLFYLWLYDSCNSMIYLLNVYGRYYSYNKGSLQRSCFKETSPPLDNDGFHGACYVFHRKR